MFYVPILFIVPMMSFQIIDMHSDMINFMLEQTCYIQTDLRFITK